MDCPPFLCGEIAELNFQGVLDLQELNVVGAVKNFSRGLRIIQVHLNHAEMYCSGNRLYEGFLDCPRYCTSDVHKMLFSAAVPDPVSVLATRKGTYFALYRRALHIAFDNFPLSGTPPIIPFRSCHLIAAVLTYNLGLAHHLEALRQGDLQMLCKTLDFYSFSDTSLSLASSSMGNLGALAIANNMCHVFACLQNLKVTDPCVRDFRQRLVYLVDRHSISDEDEQYKVFLQNMTCNLTDCEFLCAPAA